MSLTTQVIEKKYAFTNMVFEGGGVKGIAYGGAIEMLDSMELLDSIDRFAGASAGAINATLLALGYSAQEMATLISETDFNDFADDSIGFLRDARRVWENYGWHKGKAFETWIGERIREKTGSSDTTFGDLKNEIELGNRDYRHLYIVGTNLSTQEQEVYCSEATKNKTPEFLHMKIREAVRISMSIPLYFQAVLNDENQILVDGGLTYNYPIDLFDHVDYLKNPSNGEAVKYNCTEGFIFNHETLGFRLDDRGKAEQALRSGTNIPHTIDSFGSYAWALVSYMRQMASRLHLHKNDWNRTISIDTSIVKVTEFDVSRAKVAELLKNGKRAVVTHFIWRLGNLPEEKGMQLPE